jgi:hypothetical protein
MWFSKTSLQFNTIEPLKLMGLQEYYGFTGFLLAIVIVMVYQFNESIIYSIVPNDDDGARISEDFTLSLITDPRASFKEVGFYRC